MKSFLENHLVIARSLCIVICFIMCNYAVVARAEEVIEVTAFEYPPLMSSKIIPGKGYGFHVDVAKAALNSVGIEPVFAFLPMKRAINMLESGESYANLGTISQFKDSAKQGKIIGVEYFPLHFMGYYFKNNNEAITFNQISDLKQYSVGNVRGSATSKVLTDAELDIDWAASIEQNFKKFFGGRFDICVAVEIAGDDIIKNNYAERQQEVSKIDTPILTIPMSMNFTKSHEALAEKFRQGIEIIKADGTFKKIEEIYFGEGNSSEVK